MPQACVSRSGCPFTMIDLMPTTQSIMTQASARVCILTNHRSATILRESSLPCCTGVGALYNKCITIDVICVFLF